MKRRWMAIGLALLLLTGCIERPPVSSAPSAASVVEGGAEEIDLGDPNERTELCGGRFDLNPALPRTLDERRAALLAQLDLSDCGVIGLTPVGADEEVALPAGATAQSVLLRADDGQIFYFPDNKAVQNCLSGRAQDTQGILYVFQHNSYLPLRSEFYYYGALPQDGNLAKAQIAWIRLAEEMNSPQDTEEVPDWIGSAPAGAQQILSFDEAMVFVLEELGWGGFARQIDSKGCPCYTDGVVRLVGYGVQLTSVAGGYWGPVLEFDVRMTPAWCGEDAGEYENLFTFRVLSDGRLFWTGSEPLALAAKKAAQEAVLHPLHPLHNEGTPGEIDFGDPDAPPASVYDLNPAVPRTLAERRAALLAQLDGVPDAEAIRQWAATAGEDDVFSFDEAAVSLIRQLGWAGFARKLDDQGRPYYTDGEIRISGGDYSVQGVPASFALCFGAETDPDRPFNVFPFGGDLLDPVDQNQRIQQLMLDNL